MPEVQMMARRVVRVFLYAVQLSRMCVDWRIATTSDVRRVRQCWSDQVERPLSPLRMRCCHSLRAATRISMSTAGGVEYEVCNILNHLAVLLTV